MSKRKFNVRKVIVLIAAMIATLVPAATAYACASGSPQAGRTSAAHSPGSHDQARLPSGFTSRYAQVNGFRMHYVRGGSGSPIVLIHGFPQTWAEWRPELSPLAKNHTVIAVDLPGAGDSGIPKSGYDTAQMAKDVEEKPRELTSTLSQFLQ
jgi:hypothetical protein